MISKNDTLNEEENDSTTEQKEESDQPKKGLNKIFSGVKSAGVALGKGIGKQIEKAGAYIDQKELEKSKRASFYAVCETYIIVGKTDFLGREYQIRAYRDRATKELFFLNDEPRLSEISSHVKLKNISDQSEIQIQEVDKKLSLFPITVANTQYELAGKKASYQFFNSQSVVQNITSSTTQNVNISGNNYGNISQSVNIEQQLTQLEKDIKNCKGSLWGGKKKEAEKLFEEFKKCVLSHKKDETLFSKFLNVLKSLALNTAVALAETLIVQLFR